MTETDATPRHGHASRARQDARKIRRALARKNAKRIGQADSQHPQRPSPSPAPTDPGVCIARCAEEQISDRYVWGTAGPDTFDCSGLVAYCYQRCTSEAISHSSHTQATLGKAVEGPLRPGDILVYGDGDHVGIVTGENRQVTALNERSGVVAAEIPGNMGLPFSGARRLV